DLIVLSFVARVEVVSALWRKNRTGELAEGDVAVLAEAFTYDWALGGRLVPVAITTDVLEEAVGLVARHRLRANDGVQLASAVAARRADPGIDTVACADCQLTSAALREGFRLLADRDSASPHRASDHH
ncbi:MAG: type II toxin-antitoxin system VapC family toxin, partial [Mycobacteriaceae bacterium]